MLVGDPSVILTWLYVPGDRRDRIPKALAAGADRVVVDLEDAVAPSRKDEARAAAVDALRGPAPCGVEVRVNAMDTPWFEEDVAAVRELDPGVVVRVPKVETPDQVRELEELLPGRRLVLLLETALGVENAHAVASVSPMVEAVGLGEADLRSDLGATDDSVLQWARARLVVACAAAGLRPPAMSVHTNLADLEALERSTRQGRAMGFLGRAAIHPRQLSVIRAAFAPTPEEIAEAGAVLDAVEAAKLDGRGTAVLDSGRFVDAAMVRGAARVLAIAEAVARPSHPA